MDLLNSSSDALDSQMADDYFRSDRMTVEAIHFRAVDATSRHNCAEKDLILDLQEMDHHKGYFHYECSSLYQYATHVLGLSPDVAYNFINVARQAMRVPELQHAIDSNEVSVSKVRKIMP